jgi:hypothetical protein
LENAVQEFDKHHVPEIVTRFEAPITVRTYCHSSSAPVSDMPKRKPRAATRCSSPASVPQDTPPVDSVIDEREEAAFVSLSDPYSCNQQNFRDFDHMASPMYDCSPLGAMDSMRSFERGVFQPPYSCNQKFDHMTSPMDDCSPLGATVDSMPSFEPGPFQPSLTNFMFMNSWSLPMNFQWLPATPNYLPSSTSESSSLQSFESLEKSAGDFAATFSAMSQSQDQHCGARADGLFPLHWMAGQ